MNGLEEEKAVSRGTESRYHRSIQSSKIHRKRNNCGIAVGEKKIVSGQSSSGYVDENGKLLLEVEVTESLCANMSTRISPVHDNINEEKGHVEVTIVRPLPGGISDNAFARPPTNIPDRVEKNNAWMLEKSANVVNERREPLIELGALHKILDRLRPDDLESTSAWYSSEPCCREIVQRFQNLLGEWASDRERLDRCLAIDRTLTRCENCGVIKCSEMPRYRVNIVEKKHTEKVSSERDSKLINTATLRTNKVEIVKNRYKSEIASREKIAPKINPIPVSKQASARGTNDRRTINSSTEKNSIKSDTKKNGSGGMSKNITASKNPHNLIDTLQVTGSKFVEKSHQKSIDTEQEKNFTLMETVKYLARGNFNVTEEAKSQNFSNKTTILQRPYCREQKIERKHSFHLHGSRDVDFHQKSNFLLSNRLDPKVESVDKFRVKRKEGTVILDNSSRESVNSLKDNYGKLHETDTSTLSSSSAENLIRQWMKCNVQSGVSSGRKNYVASDNFPDGIRAEPSLNNVRIIRAQIAEAIKNFANRSTISEDDLHSQSKFSERNLSVSPYEASKNGFPQNSNESRSEIDDSTGMQRYSKAEEKLRGKISKGLSNRDGYIPDYMAIDVPDSTQVLSRMTEKNSPSALTVVSSTSFNYQDLSIENSELFERQILYDQFSSPDTVSRDSLTAAAASKVLLIYRKILESNEEMDWESFEQLVTALHPSQRELWCDICKAVSNEAKRVADETGATTEVCIEINPQACGDKKGTIRSRGDEITFELDMTLQDVRAILESSDQPVASKETKERKL